MLRSLFITCALLLFVAVDSRADSLSDLKHDLTIGSHKSLTGQFIIRDPTVLDYDNPLADNATNIFRLDPTLLTVSCERIKTALLKELGAQDQWRGRIYLELHPGGDPNDEVPVAPVLLDGRWVYRLQVPEVMERSRFISAMVEVILLEIANRDADHFTQIPAWLAQGLSKQIMLSSKIPLLIEPPQHTENGLQLSRRQIDLGIEPAGISESSAARLTKLQNYYHQVNPLADAHDDLRAAPPLTLDQLSWPSDDQFEGQAADRYRSSAQLFVHDLLQLPDGRANMRAFLPELSQYFNWQIAFLNAFHSDFSSQLALDKWWTLRTVQFTGYDLTQTWPDAESWYKLDEIIRPVMEIRTASDQMPLRSQISLQTIVRDWPLDQQLPVLREKAQQLYLIRARISQGLAGLVEAYRQTLEDYATQSSNSGPTVTMGNTIYAPRQTLITRNTLRRLDELELTRQQLRPKAEPNQPVAASAPVNP